MSRESLSPSFYAVEVDEVQSTTDLNAYVGRCIGAKKRPYGYLIACIMVVR